MRRGRLGEQNESELAGLAQQQSEAQAVAEVRAEEAVDEADQDGLGDDHPGSNPEHEQGPLCHQPQVEQHANGQEEQTEQDRAERLDIGLELMAVGGFGEHDAGDEGAERDREVKRVHHRSRADDGEQPGDHEQFALAQPPDQTEQGIEHQSPDQHQPGNRENRVERQ